MSIQLRSTVRNGRLDAIETVGGASCALRIYTGAQPADVEQANSGTLLATINLPADWLANAAAGAKAIGSTLGRSMSRWRVLTWWNGRRTSDSIADLWSLSLTAQNPSVPNLPLETPSGAGAVTGTLNVSLAAAVLAGTGVVSVSGTGAATLAPVTLAGTGAIAVSGTGAATLGALSLSATGTVGSGGGPPAWERRLSGRSLGRRGRGLVR